MAAITSPQATRRLGGTAHRPSFAPALRDLPGCPASSLAGRPPQGRRAEACAEARARAAALVVVVAVAGGALLGLLAGPDARGVERALDGERVAAYEYVVRRGDTFWDIARRLAPNDDPRPLVDLLVAAHGGSMLREGDRIRLPAGR